MKQTQQQFINMLYTYLIGITEHPFKTYIPSENSSFTFIITYLGQLFLQGYRISDIINYKTHLNIILLHSTYVKKPIKQSDTNIIVGVFVDYSILLKGDKRRQIYQNILQINQLLSDCNISHILFLKEAKYCKLSNKQLQKGIAPQSKKYYQANINFPKKNGSHPGDDEGTKQGSLLHQLIQIFVKGNNKIQNTQYFQKYIINNFKFSYNLTFICNTMYYIIGKQFIENKYKTITSQKWARKTTAKKFKRFDLIMRNEQRVGIIDWKFSKHPAKCKMKNLDSKRKNKIYYQLARKDYKGQTTLKFYSFDQEYCGKYYHLYTQDNYMYPHQEVQLDFKNNSLSQSEEQGKKQQNLSFLKSNKHIQVIDFSDDSEDDMLLLEKLNCHYHLEKQSIN